MGRARRSVKKKSNFKIWFLIICILIVAITFFMINDMQNKIKNKENENVNNEEVQNVIEDEDENEVEDENIVEEENTVNEDAVSNTSTETANVSTNNSSSQTPTTQEIPETEMTPGVTDEKQKAIELVKQKWGEDSSVDYVFDYVNENGEYVIAVKDKSSATVKYYFRVNLQTEEVELD